MLVYLVYVGQEDLTTWLQRITAEPPVAVPYWHDTPGQRIVFLEMFGLVGQPASYRLGTVDSFAVLCGALKAGRLWFCRVPVAELERCTDLEKAYEMP